MIRMPQVVRGEDGTYYASDLLQQEAIKQLLTVSVCKATAQRLNIPHVCHSMETSVPMLVADHTVMIDPYSSIVAPDIIAHFKPELDAMARQVEVPLADLDPETVKEYSRLCELEGRVYVYKISKRERQRRIAKEQALRVAEGRLAECAMRKTRIETMTSEEILLYLQHRVHHQDASLCEIAKILSRINCPIQEATNRFVKIVVCGGTGLGKSTVMQEIARLCSLQKGRDRCFIELNFSTCQEKGHANMIVGSPPSYIGHDDKNLVDWLIDALAELQERDVKEAEAEAEEDEQQQQQEQDKRRKVIFIHIDEMDKGSLEMFVALNSFLDTGRLTSIKGATFALPVDVFIVFCASSNFGGDYFNALSDDAVARGNLKEARDAIKQAMRAKGMQDCDITRLGRPIPFFPLRQADAHAILRVKLRQYIARGGNVLPSIQMAMQMSEETQEEFVCYVMQGAYCRDEGIRPLEEDMCQELADNVATQREFIQRNLDEARPLPLKGRPVLHFNCIRYRPGLTPALLLENDACLLQRDQTDTFVTRRIQSCLDQQCDVAYFALENKEWDRSLVGIHVLTPMRQVEQQQQTENPLCVNGEGVREILGLINATTEERMAMMVDLMRKCGVTLVMPNGVDHEAHSVESACTTDYSTSQSREDDAISSEKPEKKKTKKTKREKKKKKKKRVHDSEDDKQDDGRDDGKRKRNESHDNENEERRRRHRITTDEQRNDNKEYRTDVEGFTWIESRKGREIGRAHV